MLAALVDELAEAWSAAPGRTAAWLAQIADWQGRVPAALRGAPTDGMLAPQFVIEEIDRVTGGEAIIVTDVGQHQMWSTLYYHYRFPRQWISSGGLGTMGFGLPAAIGAKLGRPDKTVIDISGDGGFQMTMQELATAVNYDVPVVVCHPEQRLPGHGAPVAGPVLEQALLAHLHRRCSPTSSCSPRPSAAKGLRVTEPGEVGAALREAIDSGRPTVIDFKVAPEENVFPMVPAGQAITEMIGGKATRKTREKKP